MDLQENLDLREAYIKCLQTLRHSNTGIEYTFTPKSRREVNHGREERTRR